MSNKMTPCEKLGYKVGDRFKASKSGAWFKVGEEVELGRDDGTNYPFFFNERMPKDIDGGWPRHVESVEKISNAKLKPAKQALADAIHQNGGWSVERFMYAASNYAGMVKMFVNKPKLENANWNASGTQIVFAWLSRALQNWHQTILSRDEYFTAHPEQVKVEVNNETGHKAEVEMKSESEMTIKAGDWHKNGELPPVGEVCIFDPAGGECYFNDDELKAKGNQVYILAHTKYKQASGSVAVFKWDLDECCGVSSANACSFRPLRTERDKAIDEMVSDFIYHYGDPKGGERYLGIATKLYDAGYRKEVKL